MSIVVDHDKNGSALGIQAVLQLLLAKRAAEEAAQAPEPNVMEQLAPLLAARGRQPKGGLEAPEGAAPSYSVRARERQPSYSRSANYRDPLAYNAQRTLDRLAQSNLAYDRLGNQNMLAQFKAEQQEQQQAADDEQQASMEAMRQADMMSRQQAGDIPQWIGEGLTNGSLRYSPAQSRERQQLFDSIDKIQSDPRWSPAQRAQFESRQRERIRQIDMAPQEVPPNERPVPPQQQFEQNIVTDPVTGMRGLMGMRNGVAEFKPIEDKSKAKLEADQQKMEAAQAKFDLQQKQMRDKADHDAYLYTIEKRRSREKSISDTRRELSKERLALSRAKQQDAQARVMNPDVKLPAFDATEHENLITDLDKELQALIAEDAHLRSLETVGAQGATLPTAMGAASLMPVPGGPETQSVGDGPPEWYLALPSGATYTAPDGSQRVKP